jgi:hypothetical protein
MPFTDRHKAREYRQARIAQGKCPACGLPAVPGRTMCQRHLDARKASYQRCKTGQARYYTERKARRKASGLCVACGQPSEADHVHCSPCLRKMGQKNKSRTRQLKAAGLCIYCHHNKAHDNLVSCRSCRAVNKERRDLDRSRLQEKRKGRHQAYRAQVLGAYGGKCACCGERRVEFLAVDHINGGGRKHRASLGMTGTAYYRWIINNSFPDYLQLLCHNCNTARGLYGYCPHELERADPAQ